MAYSVIQAYTKVLEEADKMGSDYFPRPQVLSRFKKCAYDFLGQKAAEIERTQQVTDDIRNLVVPTTIVCTQDPAEARTYLAATPGNYHTRLSIKVKYNDGMISRMPKIERHGEDNSNMADPFNAPTKEYPLIMQFANYFKIKCGLSVPASLILTYLRNPIFGINDNDLVIDLPVAATEAIISLTVLALLEKTGDPRAQFDFQLNETYRKPR